MRILFTTLFFLISSVSVTCAETTAIINARALTMLNDQVLENATIVIRDEKILTVAAGLAPPPEARIIDAKGRLVTPVLMNGATQLGLVEISSVSDSADHTVGKGDLGADFDVHYGLNPNSTAIALARTDGLGRAMSIPGGSADPLFKGMGASIVLRSGGGILDRARAGLIVGTGGATASSALSSRAAQWQLIRRALDDAGRTNSGVAKPKPPGQQPIAAVLAGDMPLGVHATRESDIRNAAALARDYGIRVVVIGGAEAWRAADMLARSDVGVVLDPFENQPTTFDAFGARGDNAALLAAAGVKIAFMATSIHYTYDAGAGIRDGAGMAAAHGLSWMDAMRALTYNPAMMWGANAYYGTLAKGMSADLVIWSGDPLEPLSAPEFMMVEGEDIVLESRQDALARKYLSLSKARTSPSAAGSPAQ